MNTRSQAGHSGELPLATIIYYGPDEATATKVVVGIIKAPGAEPAVMKKWWGQDVLKDRRIAAEIVAFIASHRVKKAVITKGIMGCPHEEGIDFPAGEDCPFCPFWRGKQ